MNVIKFLTKGSGLAVLLGLMVLILGAVAMAAVKSGKREYTGRIIFPVLFMEIAFVFLLMVLSFPEKKLAGVGPGAVPILWISGIFIFSIILLIQVFTGHEEKDPEWGHLEIVIPYFIFTVIYLLLMQIIGYFISTVLFLIGGMYFLSYRNWRVMISLTAGWLIFSYLAFYKLLYVPLPRGSLINWILG